MTIEYFASGASRAMGVMPCNRNNCGNVMCDTLIDDSYICNECKEEFKEYIEQNLGSGYQPRRDLISRFRIFMKSEKDLFSNDDVLVDDFLNGS